MRRFLRRLCGDLPPGLVGILALAYLAQASATHQYAPVWRTEFTVWARAAQLAPEKPRTLNNYGVVLAAAGRLEEARAMFERAHIAGQSPQLPPWDHVEGELRARENLVAVNDLIARVTR